MKIYQDYSNEENINQEKADALLRKVENGFE